MPKKRQQVPIENDESDQFDDDIEAYHRQKDKILLDNDDDGNRGKESEEEEVYPLISNDFDSSSDDDEEITFMKRQLKQLRRNKFKEKLGSDLEEDEKDTEDVSESRGWGDKKRNYYGGDVRGNRIDVEDEEGRAVLELEEGLQIAKRHADLMTEEDFMLPKPSKTKTKKTTKIQKEDTEVADLSELVEREENNVEKIQMDFTKLSKKEAIKMLEKIYPGYIPLVKDFHAKAVELNDRILPLMRLLKKGQVKGPGAEYVKVKYHIISNYLTLGAFYMYLVEKREPDVSEHPVIRRLLQFQQFYNRLVPVDKKIKTEVDELLAKLETGEDVGILNTCFATPVSDRKRKAKDVLELPPKKTKKNKEQAKSIRTEPKDTDDEEEEEDAEDKIKRVNVPSGHEEDDNSEEERRKITYQMEKNKGYMTNKAPKRKEKRNPRVKHRSKFRRANIRRKGQIRDFKPAVNAYKGELTGIRAGIIRSRKLK